MAVKIHCSQCGHESIVAEDKRGQVVNCVNCGTPISVGAAGSTTPPVPAGGGLGPTALDDLAGTQPEPSGPQFAVADSVLDASRRRKRWLALPGGAWIRVASAILAALILLAVFIVLGIKLSERFGGGNPYQKDLEKHWANARNMLKQNQFALAKRALNRAESLIAEAFDEQEQKPRQEECDRIRIAIQHAEEEFARQQEAEAVAARIAVLKTQARKVFAKVALDLANFRFQAAQDQLASLDKRIRNAPPKVRNSPQIGAVKSKIRKLRESRQLTNGLAGRIALAGRYALPSEHYTTLQARANQRAGRGTLGSLLSAAMDGAAMDEMLRIAAKFKNVTTHDPRIIEIQNEITAMAEKGRAIERQIDQMNYAKALSMAKEWIAAGDPQGRGTYWFARTVLESRRVTPLEVSDEVLLATLRKGLKAYPRNWRNQLLLAIVQLDNPATAEAAVATLRMLYQIRQPDLGVVQYLLAVVAAERLPGGDLKSRLLGTIACFDAGGRTVWLLNNGMLVTRGAKGNVRLITPRHEGGFHAWRISWATPVTPGGRENRTVLRASSDRAAGTALDRLAQTIGGYYVWVRRLAEIVVGPDLRCEIPADRLIDAGAAIQLQRASGTRGPGRTTPQRQTGNTVTFPIPVSPGGQGVWVISSPLPAQLVPLYDEAGQPYLEIAGGGRLLLNLEAFELRLTEPGGTTYHYAMFGSYPIPPPAIVSAVFRRQGQAPGLSGLAASDVSARRRAAAGIGVDQAVAKALHALARVTRYCQFSQGGYALPGASLVAPALPPAQPAPGRPPGFDLRRPEAPGVRGRPDFPARPAPTATPPARTGELVYLDSTGKTLDPEAGLQLALRDVRTFSDHVVRSYYYHPNIGVLLLAARQPLLQGLMRSGQLVIPSIDGLSEFAQLEYNRLMLLTREGLNKLDPTVIEPLIPGASDIREAATEFTPDEQHPTLERCEFGRFNKAMIRQPAVIFNSLLGRQVQHYLQMEEHVARYAHQGDALTLQQTFLSDALDTVSREAAQAAAGNKPHLAMVLSADASDLTGLMAALASRQSGSAGSGPEAMVAMSRRALADEKLTALYQQMADRLASSETGAAQARAIRALLRYRQAFITLPTIRDAILYSQFYATNEELDPKIMALEKAYAAALERLRPAWSAERLGGLLQSAAGRDESLGREWDKVSAKLSGAKRHGGQQGVELRAAAKKFLARGPSMGLLARMRSTLARAGIPLPAVGMSDAAVRLLPALLDGLPRTNLGREGGPADAKSVSERLLEGGAASMARANGLMRAGAYFLHVGKREAAESCWLLAALDYAALSDAVRAEIVGKDEVQRFVPLRSGLGAAVLALTILHSGHPRAQALVNSNCHEVEVQMQELIRFWNEQGAQGSLPAGALASAAQRAGRELTQESSLKPHRRLWWWHYRGSER